MSLRDIGLGSGTYVADGDISPVLGTTRSWPKIPIVVQYEGPQELGPPVPQDEDDIVVALKQSDAVSSINLVATKLLLDKSSAIKSPMETPLSELEDLVLLSPDGVRVTLSGIFQWVPRLRCLHFTRIAMPGLLQLLHSSTNLVDLQLHEVFDDLELLPEALTSALSGMAQLQSFSLHFRSTANYPVVPRQPESLPRERCGLPVLTRLNFRGSSGYLGRLVARIDAPLLGDIELTFLNENIILPNLREFVSRIEMHKSHCRAHILSSERAISISFFQPGTPACFKLQLFCEPLSQQLLFMTRVCGHLSAFVFNVEDLRVSTTRPSGWRDVDHSGGRDLLNSFAGVKWFHLDGDHSTNIVRDLQLSDRRYEIIQPPLHMLYTQQPGQRHAQLGEAVVSFVISRQLSHWNMNDINLNELRGTGPLPQQVMIEMLPDEALLNAFLHYLDAAPRAWPTLTFMCRRWRQIVHTSPLGLNLRLYFTPGTPVLKALDCWPALPIIVQYGGVPNLDAPAPGDDDNIIAALKQSGRVSSIRLTVTSSLVGKLSAISEPFSELEELVLLSRNNMQLTLPGTFGRGPRLRTLHSTKIAFPSLPQLLSHSYDLVDIQLHEIPSAGYFSPESFANALSGMTNLRTLSLHFLSLPPRRNFLSLPPLSGERIVLPALTFLKYRGSSKYLDSLVARIDAPGLGDINITLFSQPTMDASQLGRFIERTGIQTPLSQAEVQTSGDAISISFTSSGTSSGTPLRLQISCKQLDWQLSSMAQVCDQFSPFLFRVNNVRINSTQSSSEQDDVDGGQWLGLIRAFGGATDFPVDGELTTAILCALGLVEESHTTVLPSLHHLHIENPRAMSEPSWDGLLSFITLRSRSGHPIQVNVPFFQCHICQASIRKQKGLNRHLVDMHGYRVLCSYCGNFECKTGYYDLFQQHLRREHPEARRKDGRIRRSGLNTPQLDSLVAWHSTPHAPDTVAPATATTGTAPHSQ
ncbi:hypothetical protein EDB92DRAFT_1950567 [Lactarius akahatsu]|uniref:C2H2-type domain-containing protein n=1 Tax=Lactarius akahatsu TaxID=416441 RepID=A0AAD4L9Q2_9AGAM|nr:hypothetical protein EDB92DRAFT_1950567 [Lactarius akahatsu]